MSMAKQSEGPQDTLMDQHPDAGVDHCQTGRSEQPNLDVHHVGRDKQDGPTHRGDDKGQTPPPPEDQAKQDQGWNHKTRPYRVLKHTLGPPAAVGGTAVTRGRWGVFARPDLLGAKQADAKVER